jgi:GMP synthase (glutamine-hydrolysing)
VQPAVWDLIESANVPVLGICYGFQELTQVMGGKVDKAPHREFGHASVQRISNDGCPFPDLFEGLPETFQVRLSDEYLHTCGTCTNIVLCAGVDVSRR